MSVPRDVHQELHEGVPRRARPSVLVLSASDLTRSPRPRRVIDCLGERCELTVVGRGAFQAPGVRYLEIVRRRKSLRERALSAGRRLGGDFERLAWPPELQRLMGRLREQRFDVVISHDLSLLPLALQFKERGARVLFDAREYFPGHFEDRWLWRLLARPFIEYLCKTCMPGVDKGVTVSQGIADAYRTRYGVEMEVYPSFPEFHALAPQPVNADAIRLIHHGNATASRRIEGMIEMMDHTHERFTLDLMLVKLDGRYGARLRQLVARRNNVRLVQPVPFEQIIPTLARYDMGVFTAVPSTFNLRHTLPNKFFEFVQARLGVAIGPSLEMRRFVERYGLGTVARDFSPAAMADALNSLSVDEIWRFKQAADAAAHSMHAGLNCRRLHELLDDLTAGGAGSRPVH